MAKPRKNETVLVKSLHRDFAPLNSERYVTEEEARLLCLIGRAVRVAATTHREMVAGERGALHREIVTRGRRAHVPR